MNKVSDILTESVPPLRQRLLIGLGVLIKMIVLIHITLVKDRLNNIDQRTYKFNDKNVIEQMHADENEDHVGKYYHDLRD